MKKLPVLVMCLLSNIIYSQITVINTGTTDELRTILYQDGNYLVCGTNSFLGKCYGNCDTLFPLTAPAFPNAGYGFSITRPDTSTLYMTVSSFFPNLNLMIYKSSDGGYNWSKKFDTVSPNMYSGVTAFF